MALSARQQYILKLIVGDYISTGVPIGSKSVVEKHNIGVSSATVRNEMAVLEEQGYPLPSSAAKYNAFPRGENLPACS